MELALESSPTVQGSATASPESTAPVSCRVNKEVHCRWVVTPEGAWGVQAPGLPPPQLWAQAPSFGEGGGVGVCAAANSNLRGQIPRAGPRATPLMKPALQRRGFEARPRPAPRGPRGFLPEEVSAHLLPFVSTGGFNSESN